MEDELNSHQISLLLIISTVSQVDLIATNYIKMEHNFVKTKFLSEIDHR